MRNKIKRKHHKKKNRVSLYMSIFIVAIMVFSGFGVIFYGFNSGDETVRYGSYRFTYTPQGISTRINQNRYYFEALPQDTEDIYVSPEAKSLLLNAVGIITTSDPETTYKEEIAVSAYNLNNLFNKEGIQSINTFTSPINQIPAITCSNATMQTPVIEIIESNVTQATVQDNCIKMEFDTSFNLRRITSRIQYIFLGVMDG